MKKLTETEKYKIGFDFENDLLILINKKTKELKKVSIEYIFNID